MGYNQVNISSGHSINCQGASDIINEVTEAKKVVDRVYEIIKANGKECYKYHDTANSSSQNLANIVNWHNRFKDGIDVSVHFNACYHTDSPMGVEVCYKTQSELASQVSKSISEAGELKNRGAKYRDGLYFLNRTNKPAILIEVCFVDSVKDVELYRSNFEIICRAIAKTLIGNVNVTTVQTQPTASTTVTNTKVEDNFKTWVSRLQAECNKQGFSNQSVDGIPGPKTLAGCPLLRKGSQGNITKLLQERLVKIGYNTNGVDGIFGNGTYSAIREFQKTRGLSIDGIVGQNTWRKLLNL
ncbi:MAG: N-acetylmuramoyl-L-alanine amidase [Clostridium sp.]|nr:N-acetylmuramoyl-L-alanine amidase [Clostridium sp.]